LQDQAQDFMFQDQDHSRKLRPIMPTKTGPFHSRKIEEQ